MLNGKFYTGLTEKMMEHRNGPNRQKTNFFWPDESDMEQVVDSKTKLRATAKKEFAPERSDFKDLNPNTLYKKELSSKIEFHDKVDNEKKPAMKTVDSPNKPNNIKIRDTFSSKIQFYDYEDDPKPKTNNNFKVHVEKNTKNCDKRISFTENKLQDKNTTRSILKNNMDTASTIKPSMQQTSTARSNLSKSRSMTDITAQDNINVIENNVKNISISHSRNHKCHEREEPDEERFPRRRYHGSQLRSGPISRTTRPVGQYTANSDDYYYAHKKQSNPQHQTIAQNYEIIPDQDDFYDLQSSGNKRNAHQYFNHTMDRRINRRGYDDDDYKYATRKPIIKPELRTGGFKPMTHNINRDVSPEYSRQEDAIPTRNIHDIGDVQKVNNHNYTRNLTKTPPHKQERAHRHLVSNIGFGKDFMNTNTPKSIRNSAVTRVSVGLPDS